MNKVMAEVSLHLVAVVRVLRETQEWMTHHEIATRAGIAPRTAHNHCNHMVALGVVELAEVFPRHRYRWSPSASKSNASFVNRVEAAEKVFGTAVPTGKGERVKP